MRKKKFKPQPFSEYQEVTSIRKNVSLRNKFLPGFTLLEVIVSLSVVAISFVVLLYTHALNIQRVNQAKNIFLATTLAQRKIAEIELLGFSSLTNDKGSFSDYPDFKWEREMYPTPFEEVKKVVLSIFWVEGGKEKSLKLTNYISPGKK